MTNSQNYQLKNFISFPFIFWIIMVLVHISWNAIGQERLYKYDVNVETPYVDSQKLLLKQNLRINPGLNYPTSVERFYKETGYQLQWVEKGRHNPQIVPAMMLLDCVQQFGLDQEDFHPDEINYDNLEGLKANDKPFTEKERELFDVKLTDALITFMNHLHYGKFNVKYSSIKTDWDSDSDFNAVENLMVFLKSKDFFTAMTSVQPSLKEYDDLQKYMRLVRGQYMEDNYEFPDEKVQTMAINMERLRWLSIENNNHIIVNIPAKNLKLYTIDSIYHFDTVVGGINSPTPTIESIIKHFTIAPIQKVTTPIHTSGILQKVNGPTHLKVNQYHKRISVYFNNTTMIDLHNVAPLKSKKQIDTTVTDYGIGVKNIEKLLVILLEQDGSGQKVPMLRKAFEKNILLDFKLTKPIPIAVTYLTCEIVEGQLKIYDDVYKQDQMLINRMFHAPIMTIAEVKRK